MTIWHDLDQFDRLFVVWAFVLQIIFIIHFALRKPFFETYTLKYGWIVYALCIPAAADQHYPLASRKKLVILAGGVPLHCLCCFRLLGGLSATDSLA